MQELPLQSYNISRLMHWEVVKKMDVFVNFKLSLVNQYRAHLRYECHLYFYAFTLSVWFASYWKEAFRPESVKPQIFSELIKTRMCLLKKVRDNEKIFAKWILSILFVWVNVVWNKYFASNKRVSRMITQRVDAYTGRVQSKLHNI